MGPGKGPGGHGNSGGRTGRAGRGTSQSSQGGLQRYHRRDPSGTVLYKLIERNYEQLSCQWAERFEEKHGLYRSGYTRVLEEYLKCGILENGIALVVCSECGASFVVGLSCKQRCICPACSAKSAYVLRQV